MTGLKPVDGIGAVIRMANPEGYMAAYVEVHVGRHTGLLALPKARAFLDQLTARVALAETIERGQREKDGPAPMPERRYGSALTVKLEVVHDDDRHELVEVIGARLTGILEREGCDVYGAVLTAEADHVEKHLDEEGAPEE